MSVMEQMHDQNQGEEIRMMSEIMEVPLPRAASRRLISFFTFQISIFFSASFACGALMMSRDVVDESYDVDNGTLLLDG